MSRVARERNEEPQRLGGQQEEGVKRLRREKGRFAKRVPACRSAGGVRSMSVSEKTV